ENCVNRAIDLHRPLSDNLQILKDLTGQLHPEVIRELTGFAMRVYLGKQANVDISKEAARAASRYEHDPDHQMIYAIAYSLDRHLPK
ncbi:MAG: hypothetical protein Q7S65_03435, partial [Nanoarchaeota archaeon]|nr:hypothetical protein [Nanoarchaeota archaeon]